MKPHVKNYFKYFDIAFDPISGWHDLIPCEVEGCHRKSVDIHHIHGRGKGKDVIENLMGLCRTHHEMVNTDDLTKGDLIYLHRIRLNQRNNPYDKQKLEGKY
jgi:hypothetical protein